MAEISNLILSTVSKGSNVASAEPAEPSDDGSKVQKDAFSACGQMAERRVDKVANHCRKAAIKRLLIMLMNQICTV